MLPSNIDIKNWINPDILHKKNFIHPYPFEHIVINNFFKKSVFAELQLIAEKFPRKLLIKHPTGKYLFAAFNSPQFFKFIFSKNFREFLKSKSGFHFKHCQAYPIPQLYIFDNAYNGINVHTDFDPKIRREFGMIFYVHKDWKSDYGGELKFFYHNNLEVPVATIQPKPNTMVGFRITPQSFHGVSSSKLHWERRTVVVDWSING